MTWTATSLVIQIVAGMFGAVAIAAVMREYAFGFVGHVVVGAIAGAINGYILPGACHHDGDATGSLNEPRAAEVVCCNQRRDWGAAPARCW